MHPQQCSSCLNNVMCQSCVKKLKGQCCFCKNSRIKFVDMPAQLQHLMNGFRFKCDNHEKGCHDVILRGGNYQYEKHVLLECAQREEYKKDAMSTCLCCRALAGPKPEEHVCNQKDKHLCKKHRMAIHPYNSMDKMFIVSTSARNPESLHLYHIK